MTLSYTRVLAFNETKKKLLMQSQIAHVIQIFWNAGSGYVHELPLCTYIIRSYNSSVSTVALSQVVFN